MNREQERSLAPANTIIVFDLHGVLLKHNYKAMCRTFWHSSHKWSLLGHIFNPRFVWNVAKLAQQKAIPEAFFVELAKEHAHVKKALPLLIQISNCQIVNHQVFSIVKKLKQHGYEIALLSNIGQLIYHDFEKQHHHILHLFDHIMVSTPETGYISKPNPQIYERFIQTYNQHNKDIVLIDDKLKNLRGGLSFGIIGIRFRNANDLEQRLEQYDIQL